jgi:CheY-like chemotaxis protein
MTNTPLSLRETGSESMSRIAPQESTSLRILLVEDHGETLQIFARLLRHFGHEISAADCAQSALQLLESKEFDLVLTDIELPDGGGYNVVSQAKRKQPVKAVALAGFSTDEDIRRSKEAGFDFHLTKPVDFFELRTVLNQVGT